MRRLRLLTAVFGLVLLSTLISVPGRVLPHLLPHDSLSLSGISGSLWRGTAARAVLNTPKGSFHLGELHWKLRFLSLLSLSPTLELTSVWGAQRIAVLARLRNEDIYLRDLDASLDAAIVGLWVPISLTGRLNFLFAKLRVADGELREAKGRMVWQNGGWTDAARSSALGSYVASFETGNDAPDGFSTVVVTVETIDGPLLAEGQVSLQRGSYDVDLALQPAGNALDPALVQTLSLFATPSENGYLLRLNGDLAQRP